MTLLDQLQKNVSEKNVAGKHPLLKMDVGRDVRDAYFQGIVLAAFVDDNKVDAEERAYLTKMGVALGLPKTDVEENINHIAEVMKDEQTQGALATEIAEAVKAPAVAKLFLVEFSLIWVSHTANMETLRAWRKVLVGLLGLELSDDWFDVLDAAITDTPQRVKAIARLKDFDAETLAYLFGPAGGQAMKERDAAAKAAEKEAEKASQKYVLDELGAACEKMICEGIASNTSYDKSCFEKLARKSGVTEHVTTTILKLLLPRARKAFTDFLVDLPRLDFVRDSTDSVVQVSDSPNGAKLLAYLKLFNQLTTRSEIYDVFGKGTKQTNRGFMIQETRDRNLIEYGYGRAESTRFSWSWRSNDGEKEARKAIKEVYERILAEFEFRATF